MAERERRNGCGDKGKGGWCSVGLIWRNGHLRGKGEPPAEG
jgi:hypothetical protein